MLADSVQLARGNGGSDTEGENHRADLVCHAANDHGRFGAGAASLGDRDPAHGLADRVEGRLGRLGALGPEAGGAGGDDARVDGGEGLVIEPEALHRAGPEVVGHDIRLGDKPIDDLAALVGACVDGEGALVAVEGLEVGAPAVGLQAKAAAKVAIRGLLHFDHVGAKVGKQDGRERPLLVTGEIEDADSIERAWHESLRWRVSRPHRTQLPAPMRRRPGMRFRTEGLRYAAANAHKDCKDSMSPLSQVDLRTYPLDRFREIVEPDAYERALAVLERSRDLLGGRTVWHVNSTAEGGGVAEMLRSLLAYARGTGDRRALGP